MKHINKLFTAMIISSGVVFADEANLSVEKTEKPDDAASTIETAQFTDEYFEKWKTAPLEDILQELSDLNDSNKENSDKIAVKVSAFRGIWLDPKYTSDEVEVLRNNVEALAKQLDLARLALRDAIMELPEVKAKEKEIDEMKEKSSKYKDAYRALRKIYHDRVTTIVTPPQTEQKSE